MTRLSATRNLTPETYNNNVLTTNFEYNALEI